MLFKLHTLQAIRTGDVQLAFRRWTRPTVKRGSVLRTGIGVVAIDQVERIEAREITERDARLAGFVDKKELLQGLRREGALYRIALHYEGDDPRIALRTSGLTSASERESVVDTLRTMDRRAKGGPYTERFLSLIARSPGVAAKELASQVGMDVLPFKAQVRKLKELGLTESLEVGYRLSPRGQEVLAALGERTRK